MPARLPQHDPFPEKRAAVLADARRVWDYGNWRGLESFARTTPKRELPRLRWVVRLLPGLLRVALNDGIHSIMRCLRIIEWSPHAAGASRPAPVRPPLTGTPEAPSSDANKGVVARTARDVELSVYSMLDRQINQTLGDYGTTAVPSEAPAPLRAVRRPRPGVTLADFIAVYKALPRPQQVREWQEPNGGLTDEEFAWLRVAGPNPEMVQRVSALPAGFDDVELPGGELASAAAAGGRLFVADYAELELLEDSAWHGLPRFVTSPKALFASDGGRLVSVAIQCEPGGPVFRPGDAGWALAKQVVQVADGNYHELVAHLGRTHLLVELFLMATRRHLAPNHPISRLLLPHFEGTVFINHSARTSLIAPGGAIDRIFAGTIQTSQDLTIQSLARLDLARYDLPTRTRARGTESITVYPWRDDALRVWASIEAFVRALLDHGYPNREADMHKDGELAEWSARLASGIETGGVPGFVPPQDIAELGRLLTLVVYTASAQHAAVNFTQFPIMSFVPLVAGAGWAPPPAVGAPAGELMPFLPPRQLALQQADTLYLLSSVRYTRLGFYEAGWFDDPVVESLAEQFRQSLASLEQAIRNDNKTRRPRPYTHLLPSLIPQSINI